MKFDGKVTNVIGAENVNYKMLLTSVYPVILIPETANIKALKTGVKSLVYISKV